MSASKLEFSEIGWSAAALGARCKAFEREGRRLRLLELSREFVEPDWCHRGHWGIVLSGVLEIDFAGRLERFQAGDGLAIPPGEDGKHKARALSDHATLFLVEDR